MHFHDPAGRGVAHRFASLLSSGRGVTLTLISLSIALASGCRRSEAESPPPAAAAASAAETAPVAVKLITSHELKVPRVLALSGTLIGSEESDVAAGAAGKILDTYVERGSVVKKGALLVKLDSRSLAAQAQEAEAQLGSLKAQQAQAHARLRPQRQDVQERGDLQGRLRSLAHLLRDVEVVGDRGRGAQGADRRGAARHRHSRAVLGDDCRAQGERRRVRARRLAGGHAGRGR